ncbi:hypothetical protein ACSBR2_001589 [Camellia fascicularis]
MLETEKAKAMELATTVASEKAAYPDLYGATIEQFKQLTKFQILVDTAVATSFAREGGAQNEPLNLAATKLVEGKTKSEII